MKLGLKQAEFAKLLGMSVRNLQDYEWGKFDQSVSTKSDQVVFAIKQLLEKANNSELLAKEPVVEYQKMVKAKTVPVYDMQAQASGVGSFDDENPDLPKSYVQVPGFDDCSFAVYVWNHSMYPTYENGCMVIVKKINNLKAIQYGSVYLIITDEQRVVKRVYEDDDPDWLQLVSDNQELMKSGKPKHPAYRVEKKYIKFLYLVKGTIKRTEI